MTVYRNIKTIHIHIPKTGGISLGRHFERQNGEPGEYGSHLFLEEYLRAGAVPREEFDAFKKVAVVRNPYDRCLSAYRYSKQFRPWMTWGEYLEWIVAASGPVSELGPTWGMIRLATKQSRFFAEDDDVEVVRFENLSERFPDMPHINKTSGQEALSDKDRKTIRDTYAEDFERFGYGP